MREEAWGRGRESGLSGKRVLIVASQVAATKLCGELVRRGARPLWCPVTQLARMGGDIGLAPDESQPQSATALLYAVLELSSYNVVALFDRQSILALWSAALEIADGSEDIARRALQAAGVGVCCFADLAPMVTEKLGLDAKFIPFDATPASILAILTLNQTRDMSSARILLLGSYREAVESDATANEELVELSWERAVARALSERGRMTVELVPAYKITSRDDAQWKLEREWYQNGAFNALWMAGAEDVLAFNACLPMQERSSNSIVFAQSAAARHAVSLCEGKADLCGDDVLSQQQSSGSTRNAFPVLPLRRHECYGLGIMTDVLENFFFQQSPYLIY